MDLLVLGGTVFLGRWIVATTRERGHRVTLFTRGLTNSSLFPDVPKLRGDRDGDLAALADGRWDAVIDTSGYVPRVVEQSARLLEPRADHYTFVSSISAYASFERSVREHSPLARLDDGAGEDVQEHYGALKAGCETVVQGAFGGRALVVRPGLIVGPHDPTGRFTYWILRTAAGGEVLAPGRPERKVQLIDVRDLAEWIVAMVERREGGVYNATGAEPPLTMGGVLEACAAVSGGDARVTWVDDDFLLSRDIGQWDELPLWIADEELEGLLDADIARAVAEGLTFRTLEDTATATLAWARSGEVPSDKPGLQFPPAGLAPEREADLLAQWHAMD